MKVLNISKSYRTGGAAIAAYNIHSSILNIGIKSHYLSQRQFRSINKGKIASGIISAFGWIHQKISNSPLIFIQDRKSHSCNLLPTSWHNYINNSDFDIVIVHWVGSGGLSISDLLKITIPIVWVLHDMWIFCGSEHIASNNRYINGYSKSNKPANILLDIDRYFWKKKKCAINKLNDIYFVAPSQWMYEQAKQSTVLKNSKVIKINIPMDVDYWSFKPIKINKLVDNSPESEITITFGSSSVSKNKGLKMFVDSLILLKQKVNSNRVVINYFGSLDDEVIKRTPFSYNNHGFIPSKDHLRAIYQNSDLCVFPSLIESFGQMAAEASISGAFVIAYSKTGVSDFINHGKNGALFSCYSVKGLANALYDSMFKTERIDIMKYNEFNINKTLSPEFIGVKYCELLNNIRKRS